MLLGYMDSVDINTILEPPLLLRNGDLIATHLPLPHPSISCKRPVLEPIASTPLATIFVSVLVPELDCDTVVAE